MNDQIVLPSAVDAARSVGVVMTYSGDLEEGEGVSNRPAKLGTRILGVADLKGMARICEVARDIEDRMSMTEVDTKEVLPGTTDPFS